MDLGRSIGDDRCMGNLGNILRVVVVGVAMFAVAASATRTSDPEPPPPLAGGWVTPPPPIDAGAGATTEEEISALVSDNPPATPPKFCMKADTEFVCEATAGRCNLVRREALGSQEYWSVGDCEMVAHDHPGIQGYAGDPDYDPVAKKCTEGCRCGVTCIDCAKNCGVRVPLDPTYVPGAGSGGRRCVKGCRCGNSCISCSKTCRK